MLDTNAFLSRHSPLSVKLLLLCRRLGSFLRSAHKSKRWSSNLERALTAAYAAGCLLHVAGAAAEGWAPPSFQLKHLTVGVWKAGRSKKTPSSEEENQGGSPPLLGNSVSFRVCLFWSHWTDRHTCMQLHLQRAQVCDNTPRGPRALGHSWDDFWQDKDSNYPLHHRRFQMPDSHSYSVKGKKEIEASVKKLMKIQTFKTQTFSPTDHWILQTLKDADKLKCVAL